MTQQPPGPPPGAGGRPPEAPRGKQVYTPQGQVQPAQGDPRYGSPYPPGQGPIPPRRPHRRSPIVAPLLALIGLVLVAGASLWTMSFLDSTIGDAAGSDPSPTPRTAAASDDPAATDGPDATDRPEVTPEPVVDVTAPPIVVPPSDQRADVNGTVLFTRLGDIWAASGRTLEQLTDSDSIKSDSSPTWSPDGKHIYFIRTTKRTTDKTRPGGKYTLYPTDVMRMNAEGGNRKKVFDALIKDGRGLWFSHVVQPSVSRNGTIAVVSDGNDGSADEVTLHVIKNGNMRKVATPFESRLGHNDPAFSPDGTKIAFTYNDSVGSEGRPKIGIFTCQTRANCSIGKVRYLKPGYANPSWSPDGKSLVVEVTDGKGRDIVIVDSRRGAERVRLTNDGDSFAPVFSPNGDQIAYLHRDGLKIDLRVITLDIDERGKVSLVDDRPITSDGYVDGVSAPSWFIPDRQRTNLDADPEPDARVDTDATPEPTPTDEPTETEADAPGEAPPPPPPGS